jgi:hypothetical protein
MRQTMLAPLGGNITIPCDIEGAPLPQVKGNNSKIILGSVYLIQNIW